MWQGYIRIEKATGITEAIKTTLRNKSSTTSQCDAIAFRDSLDVKKSFVRVCFDIGVSDIIDFMDALGLDNYEIFDDVNEPDSKKRFKKSCDLALVNMQSIIEEMEAVVV